MFEQVFASPPRLGLVAGHTSLNQLFDPRLNRLHLSLKPLPAQVALARRSGSFRHLHLAPPSNLNKQQIVRAALASSRIVIARAIGSAKLDWLPPPDRTAVCLRKRSVKKAKKLCSLSPPSGALRRIGAVANEERSGPQFD